MQNPSDGPPYTVRGGPYAQSLTQLIHLHPCHLTGQPVLPTLGIDANIACSMPGLVRISINQSITFTVFGGQQIVKSEQNSVLHCCYNVDPGYNSLQFADYDAFSLVAACIVSACSLSPCVYGCSTCSGQCQNVCACALSGKIRQAL